MVRALARDLGLQEEADRVRVPRHRAGPPETLTDTDYANLLRVPDRRAVIGKRDVALLRVLGDCGLRSAELRGLLAGDLRRPRPNAKHFRLFIRGKGGVEREVDVPAETQAALDAWLGVHPLARGRGLRDDERIFVRLGRHRGSEEPRPGGGAATLSTRKPVAYSQPMKRTVDQRIAGLAATARESARGGSDIVDLRFYVRDSGHSMGGEIIALNQDGSTFKDANGDEIALPLSSHDDAGPVVQGRCQSRPGRARHPSSRSGDNGDLKAQGKSHRRSGAAIVR